MTLTEQYSQLLQLHKDYKEQNGLYKSGATSKIRAKAEKEITQILSLSRILVDEYKEIRSIAFPNLLDKGESFTPTYFETDMSNLLKAIKQKIQEQK